MAPLEKADTNSPFAGYFFDFNATASNQLRFLIDPGAASAAIAAYSDSRVENGNWHHAVGAANRNTKTMILYIDGSNVASADISTVGSIVNNGALYIGSRNTNDIPFNGLIDDVRIYNRALSADEVKRLYKIGATAKLGVTANNDSLAKGLVGWWNFDGKTVSGTRVFDASGNGNYGTMTNGPTVIEGKLGQGMAFDGSDDYVDIADSSIFDLVASQSFTRSFWIKPNVFTEWHSLWSQSICVYLSRHLQAVVTVFSPSDGLALPAP
jgi:hypothetical protein